MNHLSFPQKFHFPKISSLPHRLRRLPWRKILIGAAISFGILCLLHVNAVKPLHKPYGIFIDLRLGFSSGRVKIVFIAGKMLSECFCNLTAAGIMHTEKRHFILHIRAPAFAAVFLSPQASAR